MIDPNYRQNWAEFHATMDGFSAVETFEARLTDPSICIPKVAEAMFASLPTPEGERIKELVEQYRTATIIKLEKELFTQKKRNADAERSLKTKVTRKAQEELRISGNKIERALDRMNSLKRTELKPSDHRFFPFWYAPIIVHENGKNVVKLARYHLRQAHQPASVDRKFPGLYNARRDNLGKFWRNEFGHTHALMIVDSFYENVDRDGKNAVLYFKPKPANPMLVACLYGEWDDGKGNKLLSFAAVTDTPPPEIAAAGHDRCIVNLKQENVEKWLTPEGRSAAELQALLDDRQQPYYEHMELAA